MGGVPVLSTTLAYVAVALAGCGGGSSSSGANAAEAHLAALANRVCRESHTLRATGPPFEAHLKSEFASVRALISSDRGVPRVGTLVSDLAAQHRLRSAFGTRQGKEVTRGFSLLEESYRLEVKIQADLKALGLTSCIGPPPRKPIGG
jgi:hypothetical protein